MHFLNSCYVNKTLNYFKNKTDVTISYLCRGVKAPEPSEWLRLNGGLGKAAWFPSIELG